MPLRDTNSDVTTRTAPAPDKAPSPAAVRQLVDDLARLLERDADESELHAAFLDGVIGALHAAGGAVWAWDGCGAGRPRAAQGLDTLGLDEVGGWDAHAGLLRTAALRAAATWVAPQSVPSAAAPDGAAANLTRFALLLAPVVVEGTVVAVVELWFAPPVEPALRKSLPPLVAELAGFVGAHHHKAQGRRLKARQELWERVAGFARAAHASLDLTEVAHAVAEDGRRLLDCDQVAVVSAGGRPPRVLAVSGAPQVDRRSDVVRALAALAGAVADWGEALVHAGGRDPALPPAVGQALDAYLGLSNGTLLVALPLQGRAGEPPAAVLVAESFGPGRPPDELRQRLELVGAHAAPALANAVAYRQVPLHWLAGPAGWVRGATRGRRLLRLGLAAAGAAALAAALVLVKVPLRLEAAGQLLPAQRNGVFAPLAGRVLDLRVGNGDPVERGQELLFIEDLETQSQLDQLAIKITAAEQRLALTADQMGKSTAADRQDALARDRIDQEFELRKALAERNILLQLNRTPRRAAVAAPIAGKVLTFDAHENLVGKAVKPGDPLLRIADVRGEWEVELFLPEDRFGPVRRGLAGAGGAGDLPVDLVLRSQPGRTYRARLGRGGVAGETTVRDGRVVLPVRLRLADAELAAQAADLPVGLEVWAKIDCGREPVGYVWLYELWEFVYANLLF